jgi:hypothetical protein
MHFPLNDPGQHSAFPEMEQIHHLVYYKIRRFDFSPLMIAPLSELKQVWM